MSQIVAPYKMYELVTLSEERPMNVLYDLRKHISRKGRGVRLMKMSTIEGCPATRWPVERGEVVPTQQQSA